MIKFIVTDRLPETCSDRCQFAKRIYGPDGSMLGFECVGYAPPRSLTEKDLYEERPKWCLLCTEAFGGFDKGQITSDKIWKGSD